MLEDYLSNKPLYYTEIDYARMPRIYAKIRANFSKVKSIHLIGTNGKGTTGRFLASALLANGFSVGHYTSPHILKFNERVWLNGLDVEDATLEEAHKELQSILTPIDAKALSYFEYTTLLAMLIYRECDYVVLEAGLGGEYDATAVFDKILTLVTPISYDHEAFLGDTLEKIATTKLNAIQNSAILATQQELVYDIASKIEAKKALNIQKYSQILHSEDRLKIANISKKLSLESYLVDNLSLAIAALRFLDINYSEDDFLDSKLFGRLTYIDKNIILDVGHNVLAADAISRALTPNKYILVYNSYKDKNYKEILEILRPIVESVEIIEVVDKRIESYEKMASTLDMLQMPSSRFMKIDSRKKYLVFGSFSVVESFIKKQKEWLI